MILQRALLSAGFFGFCAAIQQPLFPAVKSSGNRQKIQGIVPKAFPSVTTPVCALVRNDMGD